MYHSFLKIIVYPAEYITHTSMYEWNKFDNLPVKSVFLFMSMCWIIYIVFMFLSKVQRTRGPI